MTDPQKDAGRCVFYVILGLRLLVLKFGKQERLLHKSLRFELREDSMRKKY